MLFIYDYIGLIILKLLICTFLLLELQIFMALSSMWMEHTDTYSLQILGYFNLSVGTTDGDWSLETLWQKRAQCPFCLQYWWNPPGQDCGNSQSRNYIVHCSIKGICNWNSIFYLSKFYDLLYLVIICYQLENEKLNFLCHILASLVRSVSNHQGWHTLGTLYFVQIYFALGFCPYPVPSFDRS